MEALERINDIVCRNGHPDDPETPRPLLSIDEFFKVFKAIIHRPDVKDIKIQVSAFVTRTLILLCNFNSTFEK